MGLSRHRGLSPRIIVWLGITCLDGSTTSEAFRIIERPVIAALAKVSETYGGTITHPEGFTLEGCACPLQCCQLLTVLAGRPRRTNCRSGATANFQCVQAEFVTRVSQCHEPHRCRRNLKENTGQAAQNGTTEGEKVELSKFMKVRRQKRWTCDIVFMPLALMLTPGRTNQIGPSRSLFLATTSRRLFRHL
jgi:hypothetical protein